MPSSQQQTDKKIEYYRSVKVDGPKVFAAKMQAIYKILDDTKPDTPYNEIEEWREG
jgi:hypothetical protein|tara:strand:+ start:690 stop:857 length:168 start_codon:yes stop_codon:yes gene_type:complete